VGRSSFLTAPASASEAVGSFTFLPSGTLALDPNTTYWLLVDASVGDYDWRGGFDPAITPTGAGATFKSYQYSMFDNGVTYSPGGFLSSFQINGTPVAAVPEPSTFLLAVGVGVGLLGWRWVKGRRLAVP
jgi:hypothetical protein